MVRDLVVAPILGSGPGFNLNSGLSLGSGLGLGFSLDSELTFGSSIGVRLGLVFLGFSLILGLGFLGLVFIHGLALPILGIVSLGRLVSLNSTISTSCHCSHFFLLSTFHFVY